MGIVNTFARLHLYFDGEVRFRLENGPDGGAMVTVERMRRTAQAGGFS